MNSFDLGKFPKASLCQWRSRRGFCFQRIYILDFGSISKLRNNAILCYFMLFQCYLVPSWCYSGAILCYSNVISRLFGAILVLFCVIWMLLCAISVLFCAMWCFSCDTEGPLRIHLTETLEIMPIPSPRCPSETKSSEKDFPRSKKRSDSTQSSQEAERTTLNRVED